MSEKRAIYEAVADQLAEKGYVEDAVEMLGKGYEPSIEIEAPRQVTERHGNKLIEVERTAFVKLYTSFKAELKDMKGDDLKVWIYLALSINRYTKDARPGLRKIAEDTSISINTVRGIIDRLENSGLLDIEKADGRRNYYRPADYASVSKTDTVRETVLNESETVLNKDETVLTVRKESAQLEELERTRKDVSLLGIEASILQDRKTTQDDIDAGKDGWTGREAFRPDHYPLVDWYHKVTGQDCPMSKRKDWMKAVSLWSSNALTVADLQAAYDMDISWRGVFTSPNQLTDKAIALKAQKQAQPKEMTRLL